jgi:hypothetical protein
MVAFESNFPPVLFKCEASLLRKLAAGSEESMASGRSLEPQSLRQRESCEILSNYTLLTTIGRVGKTCPFSGLLAVERRFPGQFFSLSLSRRCDFPEVLELGFGMKAERIDTME